MVGLILTGLLMAKRRPEFETLFGFSNPYSAGLSIKHILIIAMIGIALYRSLVLGRPKAGMTPEKEHLSLQLVLVNAALALAVLLASGFAAALAKPLTGG